MGPKAQTRRVWRAIALVLVLVGAFPLIGPGRGQAADAPDPVEQKAPTRTELIGSASARVAAAGPIVGGLNLEAGFARSAVDLSGEATRGESATMTAGAAGLFLSLSGAPSTIPEPTRADSNGTADAERSLVAPAGDFVRVGHEKAHAEPRSSEASTRLGDLTVGQAAEVLGGSSVASINDQGARSAAAIGELRLGGQGGPAVLLSGLSWRAERSHTAPAQAGFSIGSARIGETPLSVGTPEQIAGAFDAINAALASQGIKLSAPVATAGADGGRVDALRIELRDPPLNRAVAGAAYSPLAPTANDAQAAVVEASGSDPRLSQALLGANLALSVLLGNGGVGIEVGGAMAGLTTREVPDLGSLFGGSEPPLGGEFGERIELPGSTFDDGTTGSDGSSSGGFGDSPLFDSVNTSGGYGSLPAGGAGSDGLAPAAGESPAPATPEVALGAGGGRRPEPDKPGHLPAPLAATALATGLAIAGADWLARRRTVGVVAGLRAAAGLGAAAGRPARNRWSLVTACVVVVAVLGLALAPSRVPLSSNGGDQAAALSPIPQLSDGTGVQTGVPSGDEAAGTDGASGAPAAGTAAADRPGRWSQRHQCDRRRRPRRCGSDRQSARWFGQPPGRNRFDRDRGDPHRHVGRRKRTGRRHPGPGLPRR